MLDKETETDKGSPAHLVVFFQDADIEEVVIVGDSVRVLAQTKKLEEAVLLLLGVYYVAGLNYPKIYSNVLGLLQQLVIGEAFVGEKSSNLTVFLKKNCKIFENL